MGDKNRLNTFIKEMRRENKKRGREREMEILRREAESLSPEEVFARVQRL